MSDAFRAGLVAALTPVRPAGPPWRGVAIWLAAVAVLTGVLAVFADLPFVAHHLMIVPDMWMAELGAVLTAALAATAAFLLSRPDRSASWALLPTPALALWVGASCVGSANIGPMLTLDHARMVEATTYLCWVLGFSVPLTVAIFALLRRGYSLYPGLTGITAGLAVASTAAALMVLFHPDEAPLVNLVVHGGAVLLVAGVGGALGGRLFGARAGRR